MTPPRPANSYAFRFTVDALLILLAAKAGFGLAGAFGDRLLTNLASYFQDAALILLCAILLALAERFAAAPLRPFLRALYLVCVSLLTAMSLAYTPLIPDILREPVNIFSLDFSIITFSAGVFFSPLLLVSAIAFLALLYGVPAFFPTRLRPSSPVVAAACAVHALLFLVSLARPAVSPLMYSLLDEGASIGRRIHNGYGIGKLRPSPEAAEGADYSFLFRQPREATPASPRYRRVVVLVMESVDYDAFMVHFNRPDSVFLKKVRDHSILCSNYHCLNLESYTGLMTMLNGVFIPYRAYGDDSPFRFVNGLDNLVRELKGDGFGAWFVSSYGAWQARFVPDAPDWDGILLKDPEKNGGFVSVDTNGIERATEDLAVLEDVVNLCRSPDRRFIFQEMVAGHAAVWTEKTGIEPLVYYDRYFTKLYNRLDQEGLLQGTLMIITSDHGPRSGPADPASYHLPLLLVAPDLAPGTEPGFLSHLDFADLVKARLDGSGPARQAERIFSVGCTVDYIYGTLGGDGSYAFIDDHSFRVRTNLAPERVRAFQREFEGYLSFFDAQRRVAASRPAADRAVHVVIK